MAILSAPVAVAAHTIESPPRPPPRLTSVVMPVRNAARTVAQQLDALAMQDCAGAWELLVIDSGSTDGTVEAVAERLRTIPRSRLVHAATHTGNSASNARNVGAAAARGDLLAFCDADDVVSPGWLAALARRARHADIVACRLDLVTLNGARLRRWHESLRGPRAQPTLRFLPRASTAGCAVWRDVFEAVDGFDESHPGAEDIDFAWRAQRAGFRLGGADDAVVAYRYRSGLRAIARQQYQWGRADARLYRDFGAAGMSRATPGEAGRAWGQIIYGIAALPFSLEHRGRWVVRTARRVGRLAGSIQDRTLFA